MPTSDSSDASLQLKKRARRRLVGAVAFAGLAAVVLPMVMDDEPKQQLQDVQIHIPGQEQAPPFAPKLEPVDIKEPPAPVVEAPP
jgi:DedD protein